jgi:hypothetical protein
MWNAPALAPGPLAGLYGLQLLTDVSPQVTFFKNGSLLMLGRGGSLAHEASTVGCDH